MILASECRKLRALTIGKKDRSPNNLIGKGGMATERATTKETIWTTQTSETIRNKKKPIRKILSSEQTGTLSPLLPLTNSFKTKLRQSSKRLLNDDLNGLLD